LGRNINSLKRPDKRKVFMFKKISNFKYLIEKTGRMLVPGIIYGSEKTVNEAGDEALSQVSNVACLPGIQEFSIAMPDIHLGYGFPIGGVAAFDAENGVISPGGVGYDINCGVRVIRTNLEFEEINKRLDGLANALYNRVPSGVGSSGEILQKKRELNTVLRKGAIWAVENGYGRSEDLERIEENGVLDFDSDTEDISERAYQRGANQLGTLGAGNHFLEIQRVEKIFNPAAADKLGLRKGQVIIMLHTGSRGFGYQICDDYLKELRGISAEYGIQSIDSQLASAPVKSKHGRSYFNAMSAAANYAWANRQVITQNIRDVFEKFLHKGPAELGMQLIYDVSHNIARMEKHTVNGNERLLCVLRKGATRALPPGHALLPQFFKDTGQVVLLPGDMGRSSYLMTGGQNSKDAFYSCSHGAGRKMSRSAALKASKSRNIIEELAKEGVIVKAKSSKFLAEEAPFAYKDVDDVIEAVEGAGLADKTAKMKPIAVIKG
jgi:tRNA-splicing ligase RtcB